MLNGENSTMGLGQLDICADELRKTLSQSTVLQREAVEVTDGRIADIMANARSPFILAVLGEFRSGKSTIVNALIEKDAALTDELECTTVPCEYSYSERCAATFFFKSGCQEEMEIFKANALLDEKRHDREWLDSIDHVTFSVDAPWLKNVSIWDAPGLCGSEANTAVVLSFLDKVDAAVWVFDATSLGTVGIREPLNVLGRAHKTVIGVVNRAENLTESQIQKAKEYIADKAYTGVAYSRLLPTCARFSFEAAMGNEPSLVMDPQFPTDGGILALRSAVEEDVISQLQPIKIRSSAGSLLAVAGSIHEALDRCRAERVRRLRLYREQVSAIEKTGKATTDKLVDHITDRMREELRATLLNDLQTRLSNAKMDELKDKKWMDKCRIEVFGTENLATRIGEILADAKPTIEQKWIDASQQMADKFRSKLSAHERQRLPTLDVDDATLYGSVLAVDVGTTIVVQGLQAGGAASVLVGIGAALLPGGITAPVGIAIMVAGALAWWAAGRFSTAEEGMIRSVTKIMKSVDKSMQSEVWDKHVESIRKRVIERRMELIREAISSALVEDAGIAVLGGRGHSVFESEKAECEELARDIQSVMDKMRPMVDGGREPTARGPIPPEDQIGVLLEALRRAEARISIVDRGFALQDFARLADIRSDVPIQIMAYDMPMSQLWCDEFLGFLTEFRKHRNGTVRLRMPKLDDRDECPLPGDCWIFCDDIAISISGQLSTCGLPDALMSINRDDGSLFEKHFLAIWDEDEKGIQLIDM